MEFKKEINTKNYTTKKHHESYDKRLKHAKDQRKNEVDKFDTMSPQKLLKYLDISYDNEDTNMNKINYAIYARVCSIIEQFNRKINMEKAEFIWKACGQKGTVENIYEKMVQQKMYYNYPHIFRVRYTYEHNLRFVILTTDHNSPDKTQSKKFLDPTFDEERLKDIDIKRVKVDATNVLEEFMKFRSLAEKMINL